MRNIREENLMDLVAAFCLLVEKTPVNLAKLGGNGETLNKRWRQY
jgi:hypothetical protein